MGGAQFNKCAHARRNASRKNEIIGESLLQHAPHTLHVVSRKAPIALGVEVAQDNMFAAPVLYFGKTKRNAAANKFAAT